MGQAVSDYYNLSFYFTLSKISKHSMNKYGVNMTVNELKHKAKESEPYDYVCTGNKIDGRVRKTSVYRYIDFTTMEKKDDTRDV